MELNPNLDIWSKELPCWERGQAAGRSRPLDPDLLFQNLLDVKKVFDKHGLKFWISHGTLLGAIRDNQFILWDDDADIAMDFSQRHLVEPALKELRALGFYIPPSDPNKPIDKENSPYYDLHMIRNGEKVEAWFFEKKGDFWVYDEPRCKNDLKHPAKYYDVLEDFVFRGVTFKRPSHLNDWLVMMYGTGWKTPDPNKKYNNNPQGIK